MSPMLEKAVKTTEGRKDISRSISKSLLEAFRGIGSSFDSLLRRLELCKCALDVGHSQSNGHGLVNMLQVNKYFRTRWDLYERFASVLTIVGIRSAYREIETISKLDVIRCIQVSVNLGTERGRKSENVELLGQKCVT